MERATARRDVDEEVAEPDRLGSPLTGLQLTLEAGLEQENDGRLRPVPAEALTTTQRLHLTVEEALRPARPQDTPRAATGQVAVAQLMRETEERWHGLFAADGRRLEYGGRQVPTDVRVPGGPVSEILGVLLERLFDRGQSGDVQSTGIGLALARDLAVTIGGRLFLTSNARPPSPCSSRPAGTAISPPRRQPNKGTASEERLQLCGLRFHDVPSVT